MSDAVNARDIIAEKINSLCWGFLWDIGQTTGKTVADAILAALAEAGLKIVARRPTDKMVQHAVERAWTSENKGMEFAPYICWEAMWDVVGSADEQ